eukprot:gene1404-1620_t
MDKEDESPLFFQDSNQKQEYEDAKNNNNLNPISSQESEDHSDDDEEDTADEQSEILEDYMSVERPTYPAPAMAEDPHTAIDMNRFGKKGNKIPVWRKVLADDSKLFSNERTWMSWVGLTFSLGAIGTSIITFFGTENVTLFTGVTLWVIALSFLVYSYVIFRKRRFAIINKTKGPFYDPYGPIALVVTVMASWT